MMELRICHLYPDLLNLYGDRGNIMALTRRAEWRGIDMTVTNLSIDQELVSDSYDLFFLGGGQDYEQEIIQEDVLVKKGPEIIRAIENNKVFLAICGGYQLLGKYYLTGEGKEIQFLGALNLWTTAGTKRLIGNLVFENDLLKASGFDGKIVGFENHSGKTYLGEGVSPLGRVVKGFGNNGEDGYEGAVYKNVFCSYSHGSLLPKNPALADLLLKLALEQKYGRIELAPLDDTLEQAARDSMITRLLPSNYTT